MKANHGLSAIIHSKSPKAHFVVCLVALFFWIPKITHIFDNPQLSWWQRIGLASRATGETIGSVYLAATRPEALFGEPDDDDNDDRFRS